MTRDTEPALSDAPPSAEAAATVVTVTMNPTIDLASQAQSVRPTHKLRTFDERQDAGGGGINVSRVVRAAGGRTRALTLAGGFSGRLLEDLLAAEELPHRCVAIGGLTRISHTVTDNSTGHEYRFVAQGPVVDEAEWTAMLDAVASEQAGWLVASGSLPPGVPEDFYARLGQLARRRGMRFVLDTSGVALRAGLAGGAVTLIKSSLSELESVAGRRLPDHGAQEAAASELVARGDAEMVALTLGENGALLATAAGLRRLPALRVAVNGTVGAGDSFLAGMVLALSGGRTPEDAFAWGVATGAASVTALGTAHPDPVTVERLRGLIFMPERE